MLNLKSISYQGVIFCLSTVLLMI